MPAVQSNGFDVLEAARRASIKRSDVPVGGSTILQLFVPSSPLRTVLPPSLPQTLWQRDRVLSLTPRADAQWGAAIGIAVTKVASLAWEARSSVGLRSRRAQDLCLNADSALGQGGWVHYIAKQVRDYLCTNNGSVTEIVRETLAWGSRIIGINHLPSIRCRRTGDPERPIIYIDKQGREHLLEWWQVMYFSDLPDPDENLYGGGLCASERAYPQIIKMAAIEGYVYEKVSGSRPLAVHIISGLKTEQIDDAIKSAEDQMAREGLSAYMGAVIMATINPTTPPSIVTIPLAELPDGFDVKGERDRADLIYSNAIGLDPQDLSPLATSNLGTATQSLVLHDKAKGRGLLMFRQAFVHGMNQLVMDDQTKFVFTERDYDDLKKRADVSKARADVSGVRIDKQITTPEQERQILVDLDEIPRSFITEDTIPGESLSDTDKEDVDEPQELGQGADEVSTSSGASTSPQQPAAPAAPAPNSQPYLLTAGKARGPESTLFANERKAPKHLPHFDEESEVLRLVEEMMSGLYPKRVVTQKCSRCGGSVLLSQKACHHCGANFHHGGGGGGTSATHTKFGAKLTPKFAKEILADPSGHDPETIKAAAQHLHDKGYISHSQYQKELAKAGGGSSQTKTPWTDTSAASVVGNPTFMKYVQLSAAEYLMNSPTSSHNQKMAALNQLYDEGYLTQGQLNNLKSSVFQSKPIGQLKVDQLSGTASIVGPSTLPAPLKPQAHQVPGGDLAQHALASPNVPASTKLQAAEHLYNNGVLSKSEYDLTVSQIHAAKPTAPKTTFSSFGEANDTLKNQSAPKESKIAAAQHLYKGGMISYNEYQTELEKIHGQTASPSKPFTPVTKPSQANKVLSDPGSSTEAKLQAAKLLHEKGYSSKKTYDLQVKSIQGVTSVSHAQASAVNAAQSKINAAHSPSSQTQQQSQTASQQAKQAYQTVEGKGVVHEKLPGKVRQFQGYEETSQADEWGKKHYKSWSDSLTVEERQVVQKYTGSWADSINGKLRGNSSLGYDEHSVEVMDRALAKGSVPEDFLVHRGFDYSKMEQAMEKGTLTPGSVFHDKGFVSTSVNSQSAFRGNIRIRARVPQGSQGAYVNHISGHPNELEFILPRGSSFRINGYKKVKRASGGYFWLVDADYIGSGEVVV